MLFRSWTSFRSTRSRRQKESHVIAAPCGDHRSRIRSAAGNLDRAPDGRIFFIGDVTSFSLLLFRSHLISNGAIPGSAFPSQYSRLAPPPVETWENLSVQKPDVGVADQLSPVHLQKLTDGERRGQRGWGGGQRGFRRRAFLVKWSRGNDRGSWSCCVELALEFEGDYGDADVGQFPCRRQEGIPFEDDEVRVAARGYLAAEIGRAHV